MLRAMFYVMSGERSWQCCWNVTLLRYCVQCKKQPRYRCDVAWNIVRMLGYYCMQCTEYCYELYYAQRYINTACKVTGYFTCKIVILHVWRNAACKVENYASCDAMRNIAGKVASYDTRLRRILRARLQILLPVKLGAILRARLQVMSLLILPAILYIRLLVIIRIMLRARRHARLRVVLAYSVILCTRLRVK